MGFLGFLRNRISNTECDVPKTGQKHDVNPTLKSCQMFPITIKGKRHIEKNKTKRQETSWA
ncbi:hypothetical protein D2V08_13845 [Flagellimonas lutimaris]|uniref:Uncharacterized protein n=1 Tax=Flagellimonas lutimaris TaxID=475082 RepID=A0A3A1N4U9_9FLAO|nr:hypothetical protein D2V08_13845 [Allomuricauda lutimaris]